MSKTISLQRIEKEYSGTRLLKDVSLKLKEFDRVCIVGENGAGKSTILKILMGAVDPDAGTVVTTPGTRCHYVPQEFRPEDAGLTVNEFLTKYSSQSVYKRIFGLGVQRGYVIEKNLGAVCGSLSGGQQKILSLAVAIAAQPDYLLLDEPENHLDIVTRLMLISILEGYRGGIVFISHDRGILDALAERVLEVTGGTTYLTEGGYQAFVDARLTRIEGLQRAFDAEEARIRQLQKTVVILKQQAHRGNNTAQYHKMKAELEGMKESHKRGRPEDKRTEVSIVQRREAYHDGRLICRIKDASFSYTEARKPIFKDTTLEMRTGSHIVLLGRNGAGKSTFLKCLLGRLTLTKGSIDWAEGNSVAYFDQHASFDPTQTALEIVTKELGVLDERGYQALGMMKLSRERAEMPISQLSGGERMRVRFALVFGAQPTFILLDEPTNHLDEVTWEILLEAVNASPSTILLVTHDYEFIEGVKSKHFWLMHNHTLKERHKALSELIEEIR